MLWTEEKRGEGAEHTKAVSSWGLEISAGLASGFGGLGEEPRDATGVPGPPWSPFDDEPLAVTLSGWAEGAGDIFLEKYAGSVSQLVARD
jgi:hypothetical protein